MNTTDNEYLFTSWLHYQQIINEIEMLPIYSYIWKLLQLENRADKKAEIINKHCTMYNLKIKI